MKRYRTRKGETPITRIRDLYDAIEIRVLQVPPENAADAVWEFENATWNDYPLQTGPPHDADVLSNILKKGALWQAQEILPFMVCINNVTRIETHQLVRQRIGVTFSQQCSSDSDWRHHDVLVPRGMRRLHQTRDFVLAAITQKNVYAQMVDRGISVREARYILPQCLNTFIYVYAPAITLAGMYRKRICPMVHSWEMVVVMQKLRAAIIQAAPYMEELFVNPCKTDRCWYNRAAPECRTNMYFPDEDHADPAGEFKDDYEMGTVTPEQSGGAHLRPIEEKYFIGLNQVEKEKWETMTRRYET